MSSAPCRRPWSWGAANPDQPLATGPVGMLVHCGPRRECGRRSWPGLRSRPCGEDRYEDLRRRRLVAQRAVWPLGVAVTSTTLDHDPSFLEGMEDLAIEQFVPQTSGSGQALSRTACDRLSSRRSTGAPPPRCGFDCLPHWAGLKVYRCLIEWQTWIVLSPSRRAGTRDERTFSERADVGLWGCETVCRSTRVE